MARDEQFVKSEVGSNSFEQTEDVGKNTGVSLCDRSDMDTVTSQRFGATLDENLSKQFPQLELAMADPQSSAERRESLGRYVKEDVGTNCLADRIATAGDSGWQKSDVEGATAIGQSILSGRLEDICQAVQNQDGHLLFAGELLGESMAGTGVIVRPDVAAGGPDEKPQNQSILIHDRLEEGQSTTALRIKEDGTASTVTIRRENNCYIESNERPDTDIDSTAGLNALRLADKANTGLVGALPWENEGLSLLKPAPGSDGVSRQELQGQIGAAKPGSREWFALTSVLDKFDKTAGEDGRISYEDVDSRKQAIGQQYVAATVADGKLTSGESKNIQRMLSYQIHSDEQAAKFAEQVNSQYLGGSAVRLSFDKISTDGRANRDVTLNVQSPDGSLLTNVDIICSRTRR